MYREDFYDVLKSTGEKIEAVVVPKNTGLKGYAWRALEEAGFDLEKAKKVSESELRLKGVPVWLRRGEDISRIVEAQKRNNRFVVGVTGDDLFDEYRLNVPANGLVLVNTYDWLDPDAKFQRPALCLLASWNFESLQAGSRLEVAINRKYGATSRLYLADSKKLEGMRFDIVPYSGDLELAVQKEEVDACIDTVYSGKSAEKAKLRIIEVVRLSDIAVIAPRNGSKPMLEQMVRKISKGRMISRLEEV